MRRLILAAALVAPMLAHAQQPPQTVPVPADVLGATMAFLQNGGSHNEGALLAKQIIDAAQAAQRAAQAPKPVDPPKSSDSDGK
jgi:hypothetical protein